MEWAKHNVFISLFSNIAMKLKKCMKCSAYTLKEECPKCREKTALAGYKFIKNILNN